MEINKKISKGALWTSYILQSILIILFLMGAFNNLLSTEMAVTGVIEMGYPISSVFYLGVILLVCTILYAVPKTTLLGALLLTTWLGGAVATHVIHKDPSSNILFPVIFGVLIWSSIWLRNEKLKALISLKSKTYIKE